MGSSSEDPFTSTSLATVLESVYGAPTAKPAHDVLQSNIIDDPTWLGWLGHGLLLMVKAVPGALVWLIGFSTITLPAFLFTLFSTSLTFTMNATTL